VAVYLYPFSGGSDAHGYFSGRYVYSLGGKCLYYQSGKYLYDIKTNQAVAYRSGKYFYANSGSGNPLWYVTGE
jgi:hypothetical protein